MDSRISVAIIGCGGRGLGAYGRLMQTRFHDLFNVCALCDIKPEVLANAAKELNIDSSGLFLKEDEFFEKKRADLLVIATQDKDHARQMLKGLSLGYDILCEKPLSASREECIRLLETQRKSGKRVFVGHVLRYAPAYVKADELLSSGAIGKLISIDDIEQVWYGHFVHSFVRGSWRRSEDATPIIMAKSCHDLDLLQYLARSRCKSVSSVGDLSWFKTENAPEGSADRCTKCAYADTCPYSAKLLYYERMKPRPDYIFSKIIVYPKPLTLDNVWNALETGPYGRCVYHCDNDVADHQETLLTFENGVKAVLDVNAFTGNGGRIFRFHGSLGELIINEEEDYMRLKRYGREEHETFSLSELNTGGTGHGGGDEGIVKGLYDMLTGKHEEVTSLENSIESHLMAIAAEESRLRGGELVHVH
ncbi:MAG: Gfo/Idh/MocA family oxidoreductase [Clostridia bacterium]|nr:Gfo/Idh/MocA family oxidoreductase [Clostridia bacterium]